MRWRMGANTRAKAHHACQAGALTYRSSLHHIDDNHAIKPRDCLGGCRPHCQGTTHAVPHQQRGHTLRAAAKHLLPDCHDVLRHGLQQAAEVLTSEVGG